MLHRLHAKQASPLSTWTTFVLASGPEPKKAKKILLVFFAFGRSCPSATTKAAVHDITHDAVKVVQRSTPALWVLVPVRGSVDVALGAVGPEDGPHLLRLSPLISRLPPWQRPIQLHTQHARQM